MRSNIWMSNFAVWFHTGFEPVKPLLELYVNAVVGVLYLCHVINILFLFEVVKYAHHSIYIQFL